MDRRQLAECMAVTAAYWPNVAKSWETAGAGLPPDFILNVWMRELGDLPFDAVITAITALAKDTKREFAPPLGVISATANDLFAPNPWPVADEAWGLVEAEIRRVGSYRHDWGGAVWDAPDATPQVKMIGEIADNMGWFELCMSENQMADRAHFMRFYEERVIRARREGAIDPELLARLRGVVKPLPEGDGA